MEIRINKNEPTSARRRIYFQCYDVTDGISPETAEGGGQPQISRDGTSWTTSGIGTLNHIGNGRYYAELSQAATNYDNAVILSRYKSSNTTETVGSTGIIDSALVDLIWDEVLTGATHNVASSAGRRLRQIASTIVIDGIAQGAGSNGNQIILDSNASSLNGAYDPALIAIVEGTGAGQCRLILEYNGNTKTATLDRTWKVNPDITSEYIIYADPGREHVNEGLAQGGTINTITLNINASSTNNEYVGQTVFIRSGRGEDQACRVIAYDGATKIATVGRNWGVIPDGTSAYVMLPTGAFDIQDLISDTSDSVWSATERTLTSSSGGSLTATEIWNYENRTLTSWSDLIVNIWKSLPSWFSDRIRASLEENMYFIYKGVTNKISFVGNDNIAGSSDVVFTVKNKPSDPDTLSIIQIGLIGGMRVLNGVANPVPSTLGSISILDSETGEVEVVIEYDAAKMLVPLQNKFYDIKSRSGSSVKLISSGRINILPDITQNI